MLADPQQECLQALPHQLLDPLQNFMGGIPEARAAVDVYTECVASRMRGPQVSGMAPLRRNDEDEVFGSKTKSKAQAAAKPATQAVDSSSTKVGNMKLVPGRTGKKQGANAVPRVDATLKAVKPQIFNCLSCGKVCSGSRLCTTPVANAVGTHAIRAGHGHGLYCFCFLWPASLVRARVYAHLCSVGFGPRECFPARLHIG